jgi:hypothetical protein
MTQHGVTRGFRYRSKHHALRHSETSVPLDDPRMQASRFDLPALHGDGRDHIVGGGGAPAVCSRDREIALADGIRITFATADVSP